MSSFPYTARSIKKYRSPHAQDLSFPKGAVIRVLSLAPKNEVDEDDDDEDEDQWLIGELADGSAKGSFPGTCVVAAPEEDVAASQDIAASSTTTESVEPPAEESGRAAPGPSVAASQTAEAPSLREAATTAGEELSIQGVPTSAASQSTTLDAAQPEVETRGLKEPTHTPAPLSLDTKTDTSEPVAPIPAAEAAPTASVAVSTPKAAPSAPASPAKAGPPPPKPKPSGLAARIAAFNQPAAGSAAPPPLPRGGKPPGSSTGGWKRPQPKEGEQPVLPGAPPAVAAKPNFAISSRPAPEVISDSTQASTSEDSREATKEGKGQGTGFSAADAASSIKLSLKERMAALQRGGGDGEASGVSPSSPSSAKSPPPLAAKPGRLTADRRAAAMVGMGVGGVAAKSSESLLSPTGDAAAAAGDGQSVALTEPSREAKNDDSVEQAAMAETEEGAQKQQPTIAVQNEADGDDATGVSAEDEEAQRRAAIAQRLARLGGQRVGGQGPPMFGAPRPPPAKKPSTSSTDSAAVLDAPTELPPSPSKAESEALVTEQEEEKPKTLDVPRRAAPPRKKRSAASPLPSEGDSAVLSPTSTDVSPNAQSTLPANDDDSTIARAGSPEQVVSSEEQGLPSQESVPEGPLTSSSVTIPSAPGASSPPPPGLPDEDTSEEPELASGPPPSEQVADPGSTAEHIKSIERTASIEEAGGEAEREVEQEQQIPVVQEDDVEDVTLKLQTARLEAFLAGSQDGATKRYGDSLDADEDEESSAIPSPLARQLGLAPTPASEIGIDDSTGAFGDEPSAIEADQRRIGEELNEARGATPAPVETEDGGLTSVPSRPGSTRPPIPLGNRPGSRASVGPPARMAPTPPVPTSALEDRRSSTISVGRPPVPRSPPPRAPSASIGETLMGSRDLQDNEQETQSTAEDNPSAAGPALAAPLARRAMPVDEDEEGQEMQNGQDSAGPLREEPLLPAASEEEAEQAAQGDEPEEPAVLSPEQEEAARRAAIAKRMAALGGHRMGALPPIMGAPMPARRKAPEPAAEPEAAEEETVAPAPARRAGPPRGGMAIPGMTRPVEPAEAEADQEALREDEDIQQEPLDVDAEEATEIDQDAYARVSSPPAKPTSPPPVPSGVNRASFIQDYKPMSPPPPPPGGVGRGSSDEGLARRGSTFRPPIPGGAPPPPPPKAVSRAESQYDHQPSMESSLAGYEEQAEHEVEGEGEEQEVYGGQASPPALPSSPPPRLPLVAPPSAPPPASTSSAAANEPQLARSGSLSAQDAPARALPGTRTSVGGPMGGKSSARDLDLAPHTRWWRGNGELDPMRLPPSISNRPDAIYFVENAQPAQAGEHRAVIKVLFEDYSVTLVNIFWFDGDDDETETRLEQEHSFPPKKPEVDEMKAWSGSLGVDLAQRTLMLLQSSGGGGGRGAPSSPYPHSLALVSHLIQSSRSPCLPPVGLAFGPTVLSQVGQTVLDKAAGDEPPRAGDVLLLQGPADFKGKKGLGSSYHVAYGGPQQPLFAIVVEVEKGKKGGLKIRGVTQQSSSVEEVTLKLEDLKSGVLKVMRVVRRGEWVRDW